MSSYNFLREIQVKEGYKDNRKKKIRVNVPGKKNMVKDFMFEDIFTDEDDQERVFGHFKDSIIENSVNGV